MKLGYDGYALPKCLNLMLNSRTPRSSVVPISGAEMFDLIIQHHILNVISFKKELKHKINFNG